MQIAVSHAFLTAMPEGFYRLSKSAHLTTGALREGIRVRRGPTALLLIEPAAQSIMLSPVTTHEAD